jgi:Lamin Tail Domain/Immunoglobulin domain
MGHPAHDVLVSIADHAVIDYDYNLNQTKPKRQKVQTMKTSNIKSIPQLAGTLAAFIAILLTAASAWATGSPNIVIEELYGAGGNSGAVLNADYAALFNRGTSSQSVSGWSLQYSSATGSSWSSGLVPLPNVSIPAGGYYLVKFAGGANGTAFTADYTNTTINMAAAGGKLALVNNTTVLTGTNPAGGATVVDFVGASTANGYEGSGAAPAMSTSTGLRRASTGCIDTDNNNTDFATFAVVSSYQPPNSSTATHSCAVVVPPTISSIYPSSITTNAGNTVNFTVTNSAGDAPLTYFWYKETASSTNLISAVTTNTATGTLTLPNVLFADAVNYQVIVSNASFVTATSAVVSLTVIDPAINVQPVSQQGLLHGMAEFPVSAGGTGLSYRWYFCTDPNNNADIASQVNNGTQVSGAVVSGVTTSTLTITNLTNADPTNFVVVVTGTYGSVTSSVASLTVATTGPLAYWNFNSPYLNVTNPAPAQGIGIGSATNIVTFVQPNGSANDPDSINPNTAWGTQNYPASGLNNKGAGVQFNASTVGAKNVTVSYDFRATATASKYQRLQYTTDGTTWIDYPTSDADVVTTYITRNYSLAGFPGVANNPNFGIRIVAEFESTASYGATNDAVYVGVSSSYSPNGTLSYDLVTISADAITNANTPPTISSIPNQTMEDVSGTNVNFTVGDAQTAAGSLSVSAVSLTGVSLGLNVNNTGGACQLSISSSLGNTAPVVTPILVTVTDGNGDSTVTWFYLTITPFNAPPTIGGLMDTNMLGNASLTIPFTIGDDHTPPASITPTVFSGNTTLVSNDVAHVSLGGSGANRTLTITPVTNQFGTVPITISASDGTLITSQTFILVVRPNTNVVLNDNFTYDGSGAIDLLSGGFWQTHSGTAGQMQVGAGVVTVDGVHNSEDVNAPLIGQPYTTNSGAVLYSRYVVNYTTLPGALGSYFGHFKDDTIYGFIARVWAFTNGAAPGNYRIGIANSSGTSATAVAFPQDLVLNSNYVVVTRLVLSNEFSTVWINPSSEASPSVTDTTDITTNKVNIYSYALRESAADEGILTVSNFSVALSFAAVTGVVVPIHLNYQWSNPNLTLTWSDPSFSLQSSTNVTGTYTTISGANTGFTTNTASSSTKFFRLYHP